MRSSFDHHVLSVGSARQQVENELGKPESETGEDGEIVAVYRTNRVDEMARQSLIARRKMVDIFTIGAGELIDPMALSDNEAKRITITYKGGAISDDVWVVCERNNKSRKYYPGLICE
jgi:hypothetical protein